MHARTEAPVLLAAALLAQGCLLEYEHCRLVYSVGRRGESAAVRVEATKMRLPKDARPTEEAPLSRRYEQLTDARDGLVPRLLCGMLGVGESSPFGTERKADDPPYSVTVPPYEELPGDGTFEARGVVLARSLMGAFSEWDYAIAKKGRRRSYTLDPTDAALSATPWDTLVVRARCKVASHNADSVDEKTGELRWEIDRGKRKTPVSFALEAEPGRWGWGD